MNKSVLKELRVIANTLPVWFVDSHEDHILTGKEVLEETEFKEIEGKPINPEEKYIIPMPVQVAYNHYRQLKKIHRKGGMVACLKYQAEVLTESLQLV